MATPNIVKGQIALDPVNDLLYYVNESNTIVATSLSWAKNNTNIQTTENVVIDGDLTVSGTTLTINTETLLIEDNILVLNTGTTGVPSLNAGVEVERGTSTNVQFRWNESTDKWQFTNDGTTFYNIIGEGTNITANVTGNLTGNADTATKLATARTIQLTGPVTGSASFDGSSNISISTSLTSESTSINSLSDVTITSAAANDFLRYNGTSWVNEAVDLGTDTTGDYIAGLTAGTGIDLLNNSGEGANATISVNTSIIQSRVANVSDTEIGYLDGVTSAIQNQIDTKAPLASPTFTGNVSGITKAMVGLNNVDNTSDLDKPVSNAQQTALNLKSNIISPTFVGSVSTPALYVDSIEIDTTGASVGQILKFNGTKFIPDTDNVAAAGQLNIEDLNNVLVTSAAVGQVLRWDGTDWVNATLSKSLVGLANVDNTADLDKPVSNATQTALDLKSNSASPTFTGSVTLPSTTSIGNVSNTEISYLDGVTSSIQTQLDSKALSSASPTITLAGDLTGNVTLTNLASATLTATIAANSVALGTDTTGDYVSSLVAGTGIALTNNSGEGSTPTIAVNTSVIATKNYVDSFSSGVNWHAAVKAATVGSLSGSYNNGTSGVGATLTKATNGSIGTIDGVTVVSGDRILVKAQTDAKENGIYTITQVGNASTPWQITRATDFDGSTGPGTIVPGDAIFVAGGSTNANQGFIQTNYGTGTNNAIIINTDNIVFSQFTGTATLTAGNGMSITGNQLDVGTVSASRIVVNADTIDLATTGVSANTYKSVTVDAYGRVTAGTNPTTLSGYGITDAASSSLTSGFIYLGNAGGVATGTAISGDVTITNTGNVQIVANTIVNADINSAAAIDYSKLNLANSITTTDLQSGAARAGFNSTLREITASNTLVASDLAKLIVANSTSNITITVPSILSDGDRIDVLRSNTGEVTITGSGVTVNGTPGYRLRAQWSSATLIRLNSTTWVAVGDLKV